MLIDKLLTALLAAGGAYAAAFWLNRRIEEYRDGRAWSGELARARIAAIHGLNHALHEVRRRVALLRTMENGRGLDITSAIELRSACIDLEEAYLLARSHVGDARLAFIEPCRDQVNTLQEYVVGGGTRAGLGEMAGKLHQLFHAAAEQLVVVAQQEYLRPIPWPLRHPS